MKHLILALLFFAVIQNALTVHQCYVCDGKCETLSEDNIQNCQNLTHEARHFLCVSREYKNEGRTVKKCVVNNRAAIQQCDELNIKANSSCYHCDRELCNSALSISSAVGMFVLVYALTKLV